MKGQMRGRSRVIACASLETLMSVLGGGCRLEIARQLVAGRMPVTLLADTLELDPSLVSHNLRTLRDYGMVEARKRGTTHLYGLTHSLTAIRSESHLWLSAMIEESGEFMLLGCRSDARKSNDGHDSVPSATSAEHEMMKTIVADVVEIMTMRLQAIEDGTT